MNHWLVIYDISNEKRLYRVAKTMENFGIRVQKSVFEVEADKKVIENLREKIREIITDEDYVVYFNVCEMDWQKREKYGIGRDITTEDKRYYVL